jgi:hypothetical protein
MKESTRALVSGRLTIKLSLSLRPARTSKPDAVSRGDVGDVTGDEEGLIAVLIFVVMLRRIGMLKDV